MTSGNERSTERHHLPAAWVFILGAGAAGHRVVSTRHAGIKDAYNIKRNIAFLQGLIDTPRERKTTCHEQQQTRMMQSTDSFGVNKHSAPVVHDIAAKSGASHHMPQLDGLRALAVTSVLWFHWSPVCRHVFGTSFGERGVWLFFVLSGYLISGILLDARLLNDTGQSKLTSLRQFYIRRILRILPLFYAMFAVALLLNVGSFRDKWLWHATYLSNFYFWISGDGYGSHLWSLAVEEQFYLCWPALILFMPRRFLLPCICVLIASAPIFRFVMWQTKDAGNVGFLTPSVLDCLGVGALLAYAARNTAVVAPARITKILLLIGIVGYGIIILLSRPLALKQTCISFCFAWLVWNASQGFTGRFGKFLQLGPITYLGKISYGIYVIHGFSLYVWFWVLYAAPVPGYRVFARLHLPPQIYEFKAVTVLMMAAITILLAVLSFHFYETPLNNLKRYFPYLKKASTPRY